VVHNPPGEKGTIPGVRGPTAKKASKNLPRTERREGKAEGESGQTSRRKEKDEHSYPRDAEHLRKGGQSVSLQMKRESSLYGEK